MVGRGKSGMSKPYLPSSKPSKPREKCPQSSKDVPTNPTSTEGRSRVTTGQCMTGAEARLYSREEKRMKGKFPVPKRLEYLG